MKVRSPLVFEMSGKLGNMVAAAARGGITYFRALVTPSNPNSFLQTALRQALISVAAYWRTTLTDVQREAWWDLAEGSQTGQSLFTRVNQRRVYTANSGRITEVNSDPVSIGFIPNPPTDGELSTVFTPPTLNIDDSANQLQITSGLAEAFPESASASRDEESPALLYVFVSHEQSPSRFTRQHPYQLARTLAIATTDPVPDSINIDLAAIGLTTIAGRVCYVKLIAQDPLGRLTGVVESRVTIVA